MKTITANSIQTETLDISKQSNGFYTIRISCDGQKAAQKIVKQ
jgi:hypothetical protein